MKEIINELIDKKQQLKEEIERKGVDMSTATFSDYGDKIREIGDGSLYVTPLAQLGYSKEDEEFYSDLDFGTLGEMIEDFEYSREQIGKWDGIGYMYNKYNGDTNLKYMPWFDASKAYRTDSLFHSCTNLKAFPRVKLTSLLTNAGAMFHKCAIERIDCTDWDIPKITNLNNLFSSCTNLKEVKGLVIHPESDCVIANMFNNCCSITSINTNGWDVSNATNMQSMFIGCTKLEDLDVSSWNTGKITNMYTAFQNCSSLTSLDVSNWNTSNVTNMQSMFSGCSKLESLDVSNWDVGKVTNMGSVFKNCEKLKTIGDVSGWDISKVDTIYEVFQGCKALESIDVSTWYAPKVTQLNSFATGLLTCKEVDLSSWDLTTVQYMSTCFRGSTSLEVIRLKNFGGHPNFAYDRTFENCPAWGSTPEGLQSLRDTLIRDSFNRAEAGYSVVNLPLQSEIKARLTTDEIAQITAKGFTIA
jgi:surface protein